MRKRLIRITIFVYVFNCLQSCCPVRTTIERQEDRQQVIIQDSSGRKIMQEISKKNIRIVIGVNE